MRLQKRFFYPGERILKVVSIRTLSTPTYGKFVMVKFIKDFGDGPMEITQGFHPDEWVLAERELMEMQVPGVEVNLFE